MVVSWLKFFEPCFANYVQTTHKALKADLRISHLSHYDCVAFLADYCI